MSYAVKSREELLRELYARLGEWTLADWLAGGDDEDEDDDDDDAEWERESRRRFKRRRMLWNDDIFEGLV